MSTTTDNAVPKTDRGRFSFQHRWFERTLEHWEERTSSLRGKKLRVMEVGSFEGGSATWILDNLMDHPESTFTTIDTFGGSMEFQNDTYKEFDAYDIPSLEKRFRSNVAKCQHANKLNIIKQSSLDALPMLKHQGARFDFIYIDGSHVAFDVLHDAVLAWNMLEVGGTIVFDDYTLDRYNEESYNPAVAVDSLIRCAAAHAQAVQAGSQMWVKKVPEQFPPTLNPKRELIVEDN
ncbi:SAM-dependent methyltransferase [Colletotrichum graminicola]|uniref:SAM-dependent methyltransferase n=1 Tax=Colletotrichum graminicola (strain M1.001 / M2 / FGSC 10212) TaxID=645133 RepID=E3R0B3_COLGM|nr:SAM-dependent methyltransferase [Colletotrichum graminicola M1.001]EFQ36551.1 SAM-dependent methyltransferase [Colletotrichum graminicola M1.001]WDK08787.1 SAM-dependent methyltransferase [Colletotrichum graminicola]